MINELILQYLEFASGDHVEHDSPTGELHDIRGAVCALQRLSGGTPVADFTPESRELVRRAMIDDGLSGGKINGRVGEIKRMSRWVTPDGLASSATLHALTAVAGLKQDQSSARETGPATTVPDDIVRSTLARLNDHVPAMAQVQEWTGMRPQEVRNLRACDLDRTGDVWICLPWTHKAEHHGHSRRIVVGPRAQMVLEPFLRHDDPSRSVFRPKDAVASARSGGNRDCGPGNTSPGDTRGPRRERSRIRPRQSDLHPFKVKAIVEYLAVFEEGNSVPSTLMTAAKLASRVWTTSGVVPLEVTFAGRALRLWSV